MKPTLLRVLWIVVFFSVLSTQSGQALSFTTTNLKNVTARPCRFIEIQNLSDLSHLAQKRWRGKTCFKAEIYYIGDHVKLVPVGESNDDSGLGIYISTRKLTQKQITALNDLKQGDIVFVRGHLKFDNTCWNVGLPANYVGMCAPERHPIVLHDALFARTK